MNAKNVCTIFIFRTILILISLVFLSEAQNQLTMNNASSLSKYGTDLLQMHEANYIWIVDQLYSNVRYKDNYSIYSPPFSGNMDDGLKWYLSCNFYTGVDGKGFNIFIRLSSESEKSTAWIANGEVSIWGDERRTVSLWHKEFSNNALKKIEYYDHGWGFANNSRNDTIFSKNKLIISTKFQYCTDAPAFSQSRQTTRTTHQPSTTDGKLLFANLTSLFNSSRLADVLLVVNGTQYPAHKIILAARSPVFAAIFESCEKRDDHLIRLNITNIKEPAASEMLRYIYTGKSENLDRIADQLLVAADKYGLNELKTICSETMQKNLTVENAAKTLALADKYDAADLRAKAIAFISINYAEVHNTAGWKRIIKKYPEIVHDVCHHAASLLKHIKC